MHQGASGMPGALDAFTEASAVPPVCPGIYGERLLYVVLVGLDHFLENVQRFPK